MAGPANNDLVAFLRHYGPIAVSDAMYDELIQGEIDRYQITPAVTIPPARLDDLIENFESAAPKSVILTGTAGDGKTFHCRRLWTHFGGSAAEWSRGDKIARLALPGGATLVIVKDLSELKADQKATLMPELSAAVQGRDPATVYLVAANDGQLISSWRGWAEAQTPPPGGAPDPGALGVFAEIEAMLVDNRSTSPHLSLQLYNLSRQDVAQQFDALIEKVVEHPQWADCGGCPLLNPDAETTCPIRINREQLRAGSQFRARLLEMIRLAAANRLHLPIRHLLLLTVNIILGDGKTRTHLSSCRTAKNRAQDDEHAYTNPYANVFGGNLPDATRRQYQAFTVFESFGVGQETDNAFDNLLVYGRDVEQERYARLVDNDPFYGGYAYRDKLRDYLDDDRADTRSFLHALERQRQRLFFTLPEGEDLDPWQLSVYRNAGQFLTFGARLRAGRDVTAIAERLVVGLNRTLCGMMIEDSGEVFLASSGGDGRGKVASVMNHSVPVKRRGRDAYLQFEMPEGAVTPRITILDPVPQPGERAQIDTLDLHLTHFEYLMRVAQGSLPASFSHQCFEDLLDFKLRLIERLDQIYGVHGDTDTQVEFRAIKVDQHGRAQTEELSIHTGELC